jgi:hypothetical protein
MCHLYEVWSWVVTILYLGIVLACIFIFVVSAPIVAELRHREIMNE